jgi:hypothetical protein
MNNLSPKRMQLDKVPATREIEQGHERLSWVVNRRWLIEFERQFFPKETLNWLGQEAIFSQERSPKSWLLSLNFRTIGFMGHPGPV